MLKSQHLTYEDAVQPRQPLVDFLQDVLRVQDRMDNKLRRVGLDHLDQEEEDRVSIGGVVICPSYTHDQKIPPECNGLGY